MTLGAIVKQTWVEDTCHIMEFHCRLNISLTYVPFLDCYLYTYLLKITNHANERRVYELKLGLL